MQDLAILQKIIEAEWEVRSEISSNTKGESREAVEEVMKLLDSGQIRVATRVAVHEWVKKAILLYFRLHDNNVVGDHHYDKVPLKFTSWSASDFKKAGFRAVPGSVVRYSAFVDRNVVLMPSFINVGAFVGEGTMVDTWATIGSCAQIGKNCHISGGAGIGGVLEPLQTSPVIIGDNCFIGARSEIAEGVIVEDGAVISMGVYIGASTKIVDRETNEVIYGRVPAYSVVVPGNIAGKSGQPSLYCAVIVKKVDEKTRSKTSINELLRA